ncbi:MAG TPA: FAD-binding oxidoreductase [Rhodocyclaceae bacterium]|nr:FAD-binding oxidoreductase [Rhodocyclaceae bacterium]
MSEARGNALLERLRAIAGADQVFAGEAVEPRFLSDFMVPAEGQPLAVVRPGSVADVCAVLRACADANTGVVPQGGMTGMAGGGTPVPGCVVLSLERMAGVEEVDPAAATLTAWAGTTLQAVQDAAREAGFFYPLDLGGRGSCRIGGNVGTNAGGNRVIRYGMTRDLVLGLEVVLADGTVITALNKMLKNNAGYDLKQLFVGSEGTLGVVTRVVLRLHPLPRSTCTALCAVPDYDRVVALLRHAREGLGGTLSAFEMMWPDFYERITRLVPGCAPPIPCGHGAYLLIEALGADQARDQERFEAMLAEAHAAGLLADAVVAHSQADAAALWRIRDGSGEFQRVFWPHVGFDVSIPTGDIGRFIDACTAAARGRWPEAETVFFGHVGDANIHIGIRVGDGDQPAHALEEMVYGLVREWRGSISAEHGIGLLKRPYLGHSRSPEELALMRTLKKALDPGGILNPGKVI